MTTSRRQFLAALAATGAAVALNPFKGATMPAAEPNNYTLQPLDPRVAGIVASTIGIDTHNHIDVPLTTEEVPGPTIDLAGELKSPA